MPQTDLYLLAASTTAQMPPLGGELRLDVQLTPAPAPSSRVVQGTVKDSTGNPVDAAVVKVFSTTFDPVAHTHTNPAGQYLFNQLAPGSYLITAAKFPFIPPSVQAFTLPQTGSLKIDITLLPPIPTAHQSAVYGTVTDTAGTPISGASVTVNSVDESGQETLFAQTTTGATGQYYTINLAAGNYSVQASAPGYRTSDKVLVPNSGSEFVPVNLTLAVNPSETLGTVSGLITDTSGVIIPFAFVALYEVGQGAEVMVDLTRCQTNGLYLFTDVVPGKTYRVKAKAVSFG